MDACTGRRHNAISILLVLAMLSAAAFSGCLGKPEADAEDVMQQDESQNDAPADDTTQQAPDYGSPYFFEFPIFVPFSDPLHNSCHASSIAEMPNGELLAIWYASAEGEGAQDQCVMSSRKKLGDPLSTWSYPAVLLDTPNEADGNSLVFVDASGIVWLFYTLIDREPEQIWYLKSADSGYAWSEPVFFFQGPSYWVRNSPIILDNGDVVVPIYSDTYKNSSFMVSLDNGASWAQYGNVTSPNPGGNSIQPAVVQLKNGSLLAYMRTNRKVDKYIYETRSYDNGRTWTSPSKRTNIQNPSSALAMTMTKNGNIVLVCNNCQDGRSPLSVMISQDEGRTWKEKIIQTGPGEWSYPAILQSSDGRLQVTYTFTRISIGHAEINEAWLLSEDIL